MLTYVIIGFTISILIYLVKHVKIVGTDPSDLQERLDLLQKVERNKLKKKEI